MNIKAALFGDCEVPYDMIDRDAECDKAFGYEELHMTKEMLKNLTNSKDIVLYVQMGEYVVRIIYDNKEVDSNPTKPDITDYVKLLDSLPEERKKELDIVYDHWFKKVFGVDPKLFKKEEE